MAKTDLQHHEGIVDAELAELVKQNIVPRIWERDHTVWRPDPEEIANRLGWLDIADAMLDLYATDDDVVAGEGARACRGISC